jgi:nucleotide-binding universal stress UspA family protein
VPENELADVEKAVARLREAGVAAEGELVNAPEHEVPEIILKRSNDLGVQLIVLGESLHRSRARLFHASVADQVIHHHPPYPVFAHARNLIYA